MHCSEEVGQKQGEVCISPMLYVFWEGGLHYDWLSAIWHSSCFLPMTGLGVGMRHNRGQGSRWESLMAEVGF